MPNESSISFVCPACLSALRSDSSLAGCQTQCPYCGCGMEVPGPAAAPIPVPTPPSARTTGTRRRRKTRTPGRRSQRLPLLIHPGPAVRKLPSARGDDFWLWICVLALSLPLFWLLLRNF